MYAQTVPTATPVHGATVLHRGTRADRPKEPRLPYAPLGIFRALGCRTCYLLVSVRAEISRDLVGTTEPGFLASTSLVVSAVWCRTSRPLVLGCLGIWFSSSMAQSRPCLAAGHAAAESEPDAAGHDGALAAGTERLLVAAAASAPADRAHRRRRLGGAGSRTRRSIIPACRGGMSATGAGFWILQLYVGQPPNNVYSGGGICPGQPPLALQLGQIDGLGATLIGALALTAALWRQPLQLLRAPLCPRRHRVHGARRANASPAQGVGRERDQTAKHHRHRAG